MLQVSEADIDQATGWPQSRLNITCAISLQEVVNAPNEFRSSNPHFVVQHIDWIQTRYLFIKCNNADVSGKLDDVQRPIGDAFEQDPARTVSGESGKIIIPASAVSRSRRDKSTSVLLGKKGIASSIIKKFKASGSAIDPILVDIDDGASITTEVGDLEIFMEDAVPEPPPPPKTVAKSSKSMTDFVPGSLDVASLPILAPPAYATPAASKRLLFDFKSLVKVQESTPLHELGWYVNPDPDLMTNLFQWIVELHSFEPTLPLAQDMKKQKITSVVLEMRFGKDFPHSPPFVRIIRPRFLGGGEGGGGHVTIGGAICIELLTNSGWSAVSSIESVLLQIRMAMSSTDPRPARLAPGRQGVMQGDYSIFEAVDAYRRACMSHGWAIPQDLMETTKESSSKGELGY